MIFVSLLFDCRRREYVSGVLLVDVIERVTPEKTKLAFPPTHNK